MRNKTILPGELSLAIGLILISTAVALMVKADFGISTISSLPYVLSYIVNGISFGTWNLIFQVSLLMLLLAITRRFRTGYVISFILSATFGLMLDLFTRALSGLPEDVLFRVLYFVASYPLMCLAITMMVGSKVPIMIVDSFINDLSSHLHVTFRRLKTLFDLACLSLSVVASVAFLGDLAGVGIGTVIMALITGSGVHVTNKLLSRVVVIRPWSRTLSGMAK